MVPRTLSLFPLPSLPTTQRGLQLRRREVLWRLTSYDVSAEGNRGIARIFRRGRGGASHSVTPRVLTRLACRHLCCVLLKVVGEHQAFGGWGRDKPTKKHDPLQMFGPANGVCNYLAQERIYCMLILPIPVFSPTELKGRKTIISQHGGDGQAPRFPLAMPLGMEESW